MKKIIKKAFTLVELLVVIAILAVLTTIGIVTYRSVIEKGNDSYDNTMVAQLNEYAKTHLVTDTIDTVTDIANALEDEGIDLPTLTNKSKNCAFAFDIGNKKFFRIDTSTGNPIDYTISNREDGFVFVTNMEDFEKYQSDFGYSLYCQDGDFNQSVTISNGIDVGVNTGFTSITYTNTDSSKDIIIRTNTFGTTLFISGSENDTVTHYGYAGRVEISKVAKSSYDEYGIVGRLEVEYGHVDIKTGASVYQCQASIGTNSLVSVSSSATVYDINHEKIQREITKDTIRFTSSTENDHSDETITASNCTHTHCEDVIDGIHVYEVCKTCGYTVIKVDGVKQTVSDSLDTNVIIPKAHYDSSQVTTNSGDNGDVNINTDANGNYVTPSVEETPTINLGTYDPNCSHTWSYVSNNDGNHTISCSKCGVSYIEPCDEDGDGQHCSICSYCSHVCRIGDVHYSTLDAAISAASGKTTIVMLKDVTSGQNDGAPYNLFSSYTIDYGYLIPSWADITIDLNGKTITAATTSSSEDITVFYNKGKLTITDTSLSGNGKIYNSWNFDLTLRCGCGIYCEQGSTLTINGGNVSVDGAYGIYLSSSNEDSKKTTLNLNGGKVTGGYYGIFSPAVSKCDSTTGYQTVYQNNGLNINITGGEVYTLGTHSSGTAYFGTAIETYCVEAMNISGGTIGELHQAQTNYINGIDCWCGTVNITGGTITSYLQDGFQETGSSITANGQYGTITYNIGGGVNTVYINSNDYGLLVQQSGATINVLSNTNINAGYIYMIAESNLNISGGTINLSSSITVMLESTLTISGGNINITSDEGIYCRAFGIVNITGGQINVTGQYGIYNNNGTINISGGIINTSNSGKVYGIYVSAGNLAISSGTIISSGSNSQYIYGVGLSSSIETTNINITGGTINVTAGDGVSYSYGIYSYTSGVTISGVSFNLTGSGSKYNYNSANITAN